MAKKQKTIHQPFESAGSRTAFTKIARDMMDSKAWRALKLRQCGFVRLISSGRFTRTPNIYGFSMRWQSYGRPGYTMPLDEMRIPRKPK